MVLRNMDSRTAIIRDDASGGLFQNRYRINDKDWTDFTQTDIHFYDDYFQKIDVN